MDEIYVATDIETDGPSPGQYSMLSLASVAFTLDKTIIGTFERNLELLPNARQAPHVMKFWSDNPDAWAACRANPVPPRAAMEDYSKWLTGLGAKPVLVGHPVGFDYTFVHWYLHEFTGGSPLFPAALDIASYAMAVMRTPFTKSHKRYMPKEWIDPKYPHTHKALDDALGHAMVFCNMSAANQATASQIDIGNLSQQNQSSRNFQTQVTATLSVTDWPAAMKFYQSAFGAVETYSVPGGGVGRLSVDGAEFWVAEESKPHLNFSPVTLGGCSVRMLLIVEDPARILMQAIANGATLVSPVTQQHGWIIGRIVDPFGHHWEIARQSSEPIPADPIETSKERRHGQ